LGLDGFSDELDHFRRLMKNLPTAFQRNALWTAITALSLTTVGALTVGFIYLGTKVIGHLQPILVPFAVAGVLAYLLEPGVSWMERRGLGRKASVFLVFLLALLSLTGLTWWIAPKLIEQTTSFAKKVPEYSSKTSKAAVEFTQHLKKEYGVDLLPHLSPSTEKNVPVQPSPTGNAPGDVPAAGAEMPLGFDLKSILSGEWLSKSLPGILKNAWNIISSSVGGFLGVFGFLLSFIIVPLYLYYFLIESAKIKRDWSLYLPLRASAFKDEVVDCLTEINRYLIAFFRGQLFVSVINGIATGAGLMIIGLEFGFLIGLALCFLGIIPYLGIALCWIPAVIIGAVQGGSALLPADPWWALPLAVTGIFVFVQQLDGFLITPRIVGEAVGLHPVTVMASVLVWALLLGGLLGAILAVPLTASVKVLFQRYIWRARLAQHQLPGVT
jgi:predicted PurR-regulated permease PerM